ncbi:MAG: hypothetical protein KY460_08610 [Actinobacteria bacterium]|nr:hypothetical protein [Actinomycetota bacterium]
MSRWIGIAAVALVEVYVFHRYRWLGAEFHFWLHGLFGVALGVWLVTLVELARGTARRRVIAAGFVGHAYSIVPDVLFVGAGILHYLWMDVFALHIALHFIPAPLITMLAVYALALVGWGCAVTDHRIVAVLALAAVVIVTAAALALRAPLPTSLSEVRDTPGIALLCPVPELATASPR